MTYRVKLDGVTVEADTVSEIRLLLLSAQSGAPFIPTIGVEATPEESVGDYRKKVTVARAAPQSNPEEYGIEIGQIRKSPGGKVSRAIGFRGGKVLIETLKPSDGRSNGADRPVSMGTFSKYEVMTERAPGSPKVGQRYMAKRGTRALVVVKADDSDRVAVVTDDGIEYEMLIKSLFCNYDLSTRSKDA